ncbi:choice-of-anchor M domain-containing protein [Corynebacterium urogenitale]
MTSRVTLRKALAAVATATTLSISGVVLPGAQAQTSDPALAQTVTDEERFVAPGTYAEFTRGHADLGVRLDEGDKPAPEGVSLMLRDDSSESPVWRHLEDVVFVAANNAQQTLPEDGTYDFTGATAGQQVYVLPQTEVQGVPWLGWNTQSPALIDKGTNGVTMQLLGHQGPGQLSMFLQAGGFSEPQVLWNSAKNEVQSMWVDMNTHAHANWVFTQPGVHRVAVGVSVPLKDGSEKTVTKVLTFAVGVPAEEARNSRWEGELPRVGESPQGAGREDTTSAESSGDEGSVQWILLGLGGVAVIFAVIAFALVRNSRSVRREAEEAADE